MSLRFCRARPRRFTGNNIPIVQRRPITGIGDQYTLYAGNQLGAQSGTAALLNPNSVALMNALIPAPNSLTGCNSNLAGQVDVQTGQPVMPCYVVGGFSSQRTGGKNWRRVDHDFTPAMRASFRYIHDSWDTTTTIPQWGYLQTAAVHEQIFPSVENRLNGPGIEHGGAADWTLFRRHC